MDEMRDEKEEKEREEGGEKIEISKRQTRGRTNRWMVEKLQALKRGWDGITARRGGADAIAGIRV